MSGQPVGSSLGRLAVLTGLMIATLGFGAAGLCGAVFTFTSLPAVFMPGPEKSFSVAILVISVPSLLIGGGLAWWCGRAMYRRMGDDDDTP